MSWSMKATTALLGLYPKALESADSIADALTRRPAPAPLPDALRRSSIVVESVVQGRPVVTLTPRTGGTGAELIYLHGGAYVNPIVSAHWSIVRRLMARTGATVTVPDYGLAPEHHAEQAYTFLDEVHDQVIARAGGRAVFLAGDSAGGGLALGQAIRRRDAGTGAPTAVFLFSPWLDVTMTNPEIWDVLPHDPMLAPGGLIATGKDWAGDLDVRDPRVSPLNDNLEGLPAIYVYQGGNDIFLPDTRLMARKTSQTSTPFELRIYPDGFHVFVGAGWTPEAKQALAHVASIITTHHPLAP